MNVKLTLQVTCSPGMSIREAATQMEALAAITRTNVETSFNGIMVTVRQFDNPADIEAAYVRACRVEATFVTAQYPPEGFVPPPKLPPAPEA